MKAAILYDTPGPLSVEEISIDSPIGDEVLIDVVASGVCHSDVNHLNRNTGINVPSVLGHEAAGIVADVGPNVHYVKPGDHVVTFPAGPCRQCEWCLSAHPTLCRQYGLERDESLPTRLRLGDGSGVSQLRGLGAFAEQMLVHQNVLVNVGTDVPLEVAALLGCAVPTGVGAVVRNAQIEVGSTVAVVGCGGVGLNCIQGARLAGAKQIIGVDISEYKLELARDMGATDTVNISTGDAVAKVLKVVDDADGLDYSFEALGRQETCELAYAVLRPAGTATVVGIGSGSFSIPLNLSMSERKIQGCFMGSINFRKDIPMLLELYLTGRLKLDQLVTKEISLIDINKACDDMIEGKVARSIIKF